MDNQLVVPKPEQKANDKNLIVDKNLIDCVRLQRIGAVSLIDFVLIYILLYIVNAWYLQYDYKIIFVLAITLTIFINAIFNKQFKLSGLIMIIFLLSIIYLIYYYVTG